MQRIIDTLYLLIPLALAAFLMVAPLNAAPVASLKEIATVEGVRYNQLIGYGLVVGLDGTGDGSRTGFTNQSLTNMLSRMGISAHPDDINVDNVAAVMVTAMLPPFASPGARIDITVSSMGNADSLQGGTLLLTPLKAPNGDVYAVAQGQVSLGGSADAAHATAGRIVNGAIVERSIPFSLEGRSSITLLLKNADFIAANNAQDAINNQYGEEIAHARSSGVIEVIVPESLRNNIPRFIAQLETIPVQLSNSGKIIVNERTGTIVVGSDIRLSTVAVSHGNLTVRIEPQFNEEGEVVEPGRNDRVALFENGISIGNVVDALNRMGMTAEDMIAILQAMKQAGALSGDLEFI
ncbi:flagellar P-ring protein [Desulfurispirillum indicum S5]|uniref:Flagellar P-ring protein n=1 Tax=Desulfurispirillum indicum (strain ATCC BAA-1389 / DSM 22839 / S5) TaxID=653733 RepID=E6W4E2_DESIS|nr:flagellar basal body P-ring protein FlgI [Desulfurispirillum indicum]ADU65916.1 flagellar P-ring protein [Desulfurispirillum indicum S5]